TRSRRSRARPRGWHPRPAQARPAAAAADGAHRSPRRAERVMLHTASITFREVDSPSAWRIDVVVDGIVCGHIDRAGGTYRYFEDFDGSHNVGFWSFADLDLERLEVLILGNVMTVIR